MTQGYPLSPMSPYVILGSKVLPPSSALWSALRTLQGPSVSSRASVIDRTGRAFTTMRKALRGLIVLSLVVLPFSASPAFAHGGGLNADGCHTNRKTGDYHCHRAGGGNGGSSSSRSTSSRVQSFLSPRATGGGAFRNCAEARAAGAAPVYAGSPGYGPHLDRDGDGVGCEPYRGR